MAPQTTAAGTAPRRSWRPGWAAIAVAVVCFALAVANIWWVLTVRSHMPFSIDEDGYLQRAIRDGQALSHGGLAALLSTVRSPDAEAPLVPVIGAIAFQIWHARLLDVIAALQVVYVAAVLASYALARLVVSRPWAVVAAIAVACSPGVVTESRNFLFGMAATATFAAAVWAQLRAQNGRDWRFLAPAGILAGLTLLSRTVMIAFVAVLWTVGAVTVLLESHHRLQRMLRFAAAPAIGIAVASIWYSANGRYVFPYLLHYGYGQQAGAYSSQFLPIVGSLPVRLNNLVSEDLFLPLTVLVGLGLALGAYQLIRRAASHARPVTAHLLLLTRPRGQLALVTLGCLVALCSSRNNGNAFELPLVPLLIVLAITGIASWRLVAARRITAGLLVASALIAAVVATAPWVPPLEVSVNTSTMSAVVVSTSSTISQYLWATGYLPRPDSPRAVRGWQTASLRATTFLYRFAHDRGYLPVVFFVSENPLFNTNSLQIEVQIKRGQVLPMGALNSPDSIHLTYAQQLMSPALGLPNFLVV
ncbi:MAG TPA: glycosyltransferase family 39 protein, partial [Candidatus Dormibacteraeota bacterium]|nr:glycosyltransferase family 39 protein [Candidatus Dormibacteraeota bacterium]